MGHDIGTARRMALAAGMAALVVAAALPAHAAVSGSTVFSTTGANCYFSSDCAAFIATCNPSLAVKDGVLSSVADISSLKGGSRDFKWTGTLLGTESTARASIDILDGACRSVGGVPQNPGILINKNKSVSVPQSAKWLVFIPAFAATTTWNMS